METPITFQTQEILLEGLLQRNSGERGVVITHPHSLYGGNMYNPVVETLCRAYGEKGFTTLRFNFRGVGNSQGRFDDGGGEGEDVLAALGFLLESGITSLNLAGYSFGARVVSGIKDLPKEVVSQIHVAPPVAFMDYSGVTEITGLRTVIVAANDDIAPPDQIRKLLSGWNPEANLVIIEAGDHFFSSSLELLQKELANAIE